MRVLHHPCSYPEAVLVLAEASVECGEVAAAQHLLEVLAEVTTSATANDSTATGSVTGAGEVTGGAERAAAGDPVAGEDGGGSAAAGVSGGVGGAAARAAVLAANELPVAGSLAARRNKLLLAMGQYDRRVRQLIACLYGCFPCGKSSSL